MTELPPHVRALLEQASASHDPDEPRVERNLTALHGGLAFSVPTLVAAGVEASAQLATQSASQAALASQVAAGSAVGKAAATAGVLAKVSTAVKLYVVGAAIAGGVGTAVLVTTDRPAAVAPPRVEPARPQVAKPPDPPPFSDLAKQAEAPAPPPVLDSAPVPPAPVAGPKRASKASSALEELSLIEAASRSLGQNDAARALTLLQAHDERYGEGQLRIEREGLRAIALCQAGELRAGQAARAAFLTRWSSAPIAARVRAACSP